ncbi:alpha-lytic protease prodomain-containing protein [Marilutibacter chinensis]|uniref:Alpha-lytic protease prodomain-containing protein n=1 Tax=Marilutibacter chinensis TaxID=2912247 RepID=A0ABS9HP25_9GAMM|nr:alpha-lytic protease prodomain-containing protein [Lysobacter chinensis]MCF7220719.1 alpha-lytic protease prodomain-containing protein [Lysobacter chinensis]
MRKFSMSVLAATVAMAVSGAAFAADDLPPALKAAMQRDLGLSGTQLAQYLKTERLATQQERLLQRQMGRNFAGAWLERKANGSYGLVVASTSPVAARGPAGVETRQARHSLAALNAAKGQLDSQLGRSGGVPRGVYSWAVDLPSNSVVVGVAPGAEDAAIDFVARSGLDANTVRFETMTEAPQRRVDIQGGRGILRNPGDGYLYACSIGFSVTKGSTKGFATAGHCGDTGEIVYQELSQWSLGVSLGSFAASTMPDGNQTGPDRGWVQVDSTHTLQPSVYGYGKGDVTVHGSTEAPVGAALCRSGRTTGWRCGSILSKNQTVSYVDGSGNPDGTVTGLTRTSACAEGGDSGGSFITGAGQAQGVLSGGSGSCKGRQGRTGGGNSYYTPINPILSAYGLTLRTSP